MTETNEKDVRIYELSYLLVPELSEEDVAREVGAIKAIISDTFGGVEISSEAPREIELAYEMEKQIGAKKSKYSKAFFGWIKFELSQDKISDIKKSLDKNHKIIRLLIIKTVRENTMVEKRTSNGIGAKKVTKESTEVISEEELDKTIDDLVIQ